ncbi:MAG: hypothetical protein HY788_15705 [Deltaproteobacteria bacterium]|nr:hypothetical protein [Deltaproteobacteria bacterium]
MPVTAFRNRFLQILVVLVLSVGCSGCSLRLLWHEDGRAVLPHDEDLAPGSTNLTQALAVLGAPDRVMELNGENVLVYQQSFTDSRQISLGIPLQSFYTSLIKFSGSGEVGTSNYLILFFNSDYLLTRKIYEKNSDAPFLETLMAEPPRNKQTKPYPANGKNSDLVITPTPPVPSGSR